MKINVISEGNLEHERIFKRCVKERIPVEFTEDGMRIQFSVDPNVGPQESYRITSDSTGWIIEGADTLGLFYGIGKFLHTAKWTENEFIPNPPAERIAPACSFRAIQFSIHLFNWFYNASAEELDRHLEDLLLWGYNAVKAGISGSLEGAPPEKRFEKCDRLFRHAGKLGMKVALGIPVNQGGMEAPVELGADLSYDIDGWRGTLGRNLCFSKPGTLLYMKTIWQRLLSHFRDADIKVDYFIMWPYDEGGCGCESCRPWGANKYCDGCKAIQQEVIRFFPEAKFIVSTWLFDIPGDQGEYSGFYQRLKGDMDWVDYILVDDHGDFPHYPLQHEVVKPVVNFPEISMWGLYPWGGFGANPLPERFQRLWDSTKHILSGGMPYSEGIYEDISKVQCIGYYWNPDRHYKDILSEYISYEYSDTVTAEVLEILSCIECNHSLAGDGKDPILSVAERAEQLANKVNKKLPERARNSWRWRILYIRAMLDKKRYGVFCGGNMSGKEDLYQLKNYSGDWLVNDKQAQALLQELFDLYHCVPYNGRNCWTLPPVNGGTVVK